MPLDLEMEDIDIYLDDITNISGKIQPQSIPLLVIPNCERCDDVKSRAKALEGKTWSYLLQYHRELILLREQPLSAKHYGPFTIEVGPCNSDLDKMIISPDAVSRYLAELPVCRNCESMMTHANKTQEVLLGKSEELFKELLVLRKDRAPPPVRTITPVQQRIRELEELRLQELVNSVTRAPRNHANQADRETFDELEKAVDSLDNAFGQLLLEVRVMDRSVTGQEAEDLLDEVSNTKLDDLQDTTVEENSPSGLSQTLSTIGLGSPAHLTSAFPHRSGPIASEFLVSDGDLRHQFAFGTADQFDAQASRLTPLCSHQTNREESLTGRTTPGQFDHDNLEAEIEREWVQL